MTNPAPITERSYGTPLIPVTHLVFPWALEVSLNNVLIPQLKKVFDLNHYFAVRGYPAVLAKAEPRVAEPVL